MRRDERPAGQSWQGRPGAVGRVRVPRDPEARVVEGADRLVQCPQTLVYERGGPYDRDEVNPHFEGYEILDEFPHLAEPRLSMDIGRELSDGIRAHSEGSVASGGYR